MKKGILKRTVKVTAFFAFVCLCFANMKLVISQNGDVGATLTLSDIDKALTSCESFPNGDNGDCKPSPEGGYCADSWVIHDCKQ